MCAPEWRGAHRTTRYCDVHVVGVVVYTRVPYTKWESKVKGTERMKNATKSVYLSAVASGCWLPMLLLLLLLEETDRGKRIESPTTEVFTFRLFTLLLSCGANDAREYKREQDSMLFTVVYCVWCTPHMYVRAICEYLQGRMGVILLYI